MDPAPSFADVIERLLADPDADVAERSELLALIGDVVGFALVCTPALLGPAFLWTLGLLEAKDQTVAALGRLWERLNAAGFETTAQRHQRLLDAYCYAAYASLLQAAAAVGLPEESTSPDSLLMRMPSDGDESDAGRVVTDGSEGLAEIRALAASRREWAGVPLPVPEEISVASVHRIREIHVALVEGISNRLNLVEKLNSYELSVWRAAVLAEARSNFDLFMLELHQRYPEFGLWISMERASLDHDQLSESVADLHMELGLLDLSVEGVHLGISQISNAIAAISHHQIVRASSIQASIAARNLASVEGPMLRGPLPQGLKSPAKGSGYIEPAFRAQRATWEVRDLISQERWDRRPRLEDLTTFLYGAILAPASFGTPTLVLGNPGSGKSLLTEVLAARLPSPDCICVRLRLRDLPGDLDVQSMIERGVRRQIGEDVSWPEFRRNSSASHCVVILDGYDEYLQVSGLTKSNLLEEIRAFQEREQSLGRPVSIVVTSRPAFIERSPVPPGSLVVRIEDFDDGRMAALCDVWNKTNVSYFSTHGISPFSIPDDGDLAKMCELPLLLLVLALYDAESGRLSDLSALNRAEAYAALSRHFLRRERRKAGSYSNADPDPDLEADVSSDMAALGCVAIGMFSRGHLVTTDSDAEQDIELFAGTDATARAHGVSVLRGFLFVHESVAQPGESVASAYEFLHNTIGEFLAVYYLSHVLLDISAEIGELQGVSASRLMARSLALASDHNALDERLRLTLGTRPLFNRPEILALAEKWFEGSEWCAASEGARSRAVPHYLRGQMWAVVETSELTAPRLSADVSSLKFAALLSMNLFTLGVLTSKRFELFDDADRLTAGRAAEKVRELTSIWRSQFDILDLYPLAVQASIVATAAPCHFLAEARSLESRARISQGVDDEAHMLIVVADALHDVALSSLSLFNTSEAWLARVIRPAVGRPLDAVDRRFVPEAVRLERLLRRGPGRLRLDYHSHDSPAVLVDSILSGAIVHPDIAEATLNDLLRVGFVYLRPAVDSPASEAEAVANIAAYVGLFGGKLSRRILPLIAAVAGEAGWMDVEEAVCRRVASLDFGAREDVVSRFLDVVNGWGHRPPGWSESSLRSLLSSCDLPRLMSYGPAKFGGLIEARLVDPGGFAADLIGLPDHRQGQIFRQNPAFGSLALSYASDGDVSSRRALEGLVARAPSEGRATDDTCRDWTICLFYGNEVVLDQAFRKVHQKTSTHWLGDTLRAHGLVGISGGTLSRAAALVAAESTADGFAMLRPSWWGE